MKHFIASLIGLVALAIAPLAHAQYVPPPKGSVPDFVNQGNIGTPISSSMADMNISTTYYNKNGWTTSGTCVNIPAGSYYATGSITGISNVSASNEIGAQFKLSTYGALSQSVSYNFLDTQNKGTVNVMTYFTITSSDCLGLQAVVRTTTGNAINISLAVWKK